MGPRRSSFRTRATSLIKSPLATIHQGQFHDPSRARHPSNASQQQSFNEKQDALERLESSSSGGQTQHTSSGDGIGHNKEAQRLVRTIPSWVRTWDEIESRVIPDSPPFKPPAGAYVAQHNSSPSTKANGFASSSRLEDHGWDEERALQVPDDTNPYSTSRWKAFATATAYPRITPSGGRIISEEWLRENGPDYYQPWMAGVEEGDSTHGYKGPIRQRAWYLRWERTILRSPIVPMVIRMIVLSFSAMALGLAASVHHVTNRRTPYVRQTPSTDMAIIVDAVAIVYLFYIAYDEYSGKPLGLRSARAKMRLIFLDLFFIVFDSANLSLAFVATRETCVTLDDQEDCSPMQKALFEDVLKRQRALASVLLIALIAWLLTFSISITRLVEKMAAR